jgi:hypothetical protein
LVALSTTLMIAAEDEGPLRRFTDAEDLTHFALSSLFSALGFRVGIGAESDVDKLVPGLIGSVASMTSRLWV